MSAVLYHLTAATLFVGEGGNSTDQGLRLIDVQLPNLQEKTKQFSPTGNPGSFNMPLAKLEPFTLGFNLEGVQEDVLSRFMANGMTQYTVRGNMLNTRTHEHEEIVAIVRGRMTKSTMGRIASDSGIQTEYSIEFIQFYELKIGGEEKFYFDIENGYAGIRKDGSLMFPNEARSLGQL